MDIYFGCILSDTEPIPSNSDTLVINRHPCTGNMHSSRKYWNYVALTERGYENQAFKQWILSHTLHSSSLLKTETQITTLQTVSTLKESIQTVMALKTLQGYSDPKEVTELNLFTISYIHHALQISQPSIVSVDMRAIIFNIVHSY